MPEVAHVRGINCEHAAELVLHGANRGADGRGLYTTLRSEQLAHQNLDLLLSIVQRGVGLRAVELGCEQRGGPGKFQDAQSLGTECDSGVEGRCHWDQYSLVYGPRLPVNCEQSSR